MNTVFFDVDTQIDFLYPAGALYVPGAERLVGTIAKLNRYAAANGIPVLSMTDAHTENDAEFQVWPHHCIAGTLDQQKPCQTLVEPRVVIPSARGEYAIDGARQVIVQKQQIDPFTNPNLPVMLDRLKADRYVVYGVVAEYCVRCSVMGLLRLGKPVELVTDAVASLKETDARRTIDDFTVEGGRLTTVAQVCAG